MAGRGSRRRGEEPAPLGSISRASGAARTCGQCGSAALTVLAMNLTDGTAVTFVSCQRCDHRTWFDAEGTELDREDVLARSKRET